MDYTHRLAPSRRPGSLSERALTRDEIEVTALNGETPLWYYILREANARESGHRLRPVAGRIVGEVRIGLLADDATSVPHSSADWEPRAGVVNLLIMA